MYQILTAPLGASSTERSKKRIAAITVDPEKHQQELAKDRERKKKKLLELKKPENMTPYQAFKEADLARKRAPPVDAQTVLTEEHTPTKASLAKSMKKVQKSLPRRKSTKVEVVSKLVGSMTPKSKREVFKKSAVPNYDGAARNLRAEESNKKILDFLEQSDIAYVCPGRKDTVYLGKDVTGERIYKAKHYLRWTFDEIVAMYNEDNPEDKVSYYRIQKLVKENKYLKNHTRKTR